MLSDTKVYNIIVEYIEYNKDYLNSFDKEVKEGYLPNDTAYDILCNLTEMCTDSNLVFQEWEDEESLYQAIESYISEYMEWVIENNNQAESNNLEEELELKNTEQVLLETVEEIEEENIHSTVDNLNKLYYSSGEDIKPTAPSFILVEDNNNPLYKKPGEEINNTFKYEEREPIELDTDCRFTFHSHTFPSKEKNNIFMCKVFSFFEELRIKKEKILSNLFI